MTSSKELKRRKKALRVRMLGLRDALAPEVRAAKSGAVADRLFELPEVRDAGLVMAFSSFGSEVETDIVLERLVASGKRVVLPRIEDGEIEAVEYRPGDPVRIAAFGAREPLGEIVVPAMEIDVVVTPGLAFDRHGYRVGYGGGFYDRFFRRARLDALKVVVGFALQVVMEVPHGGADVAVDAIVTEDETIRCR